jgi:hypothetical protein
LPNLLRVFYPLCASISALVIAAIHAFEVLVLRHLSKVALKL